MKSTSGSPVVELRSVSKTYGKKQALDELSLTLAAGRFHLLLGPNGAGKSTLMRVLMRMEPPDSGDGTVLGAPLDSDPGKIRARVGYVTEAIDYAVPVALDRFFKTLAGCYPDWDHDTFRMVTGDLGLDLKARFRELSRGQRMQVAFAAALATRPRLLLLDEITSVLDARARLYVIELLGGFVKKGGTVIMATNIIVDVRSFAEQVILIDQGRLVLSAPIEELGAGPLTAEDVFFQHVKNPLEGRKGA